MKELQEDIWKYWEKGNWIVITTNGNIKKNGEAVMGRGLALEAKQRFPDLPKQLGERLREYGNKVFIFTKFRIITFPVKHKWYEKADLKLIEESCIGLNTIFQYNLSGIPIPIYLTKVGCGNGKLNWKDLNQF